ncbi:hypothetical protein ONZ51_g6335 [Trametes cubensis]|uniref:F-box domain-containing protein n=1 Tax=Trametes cubensis TaxID=1111947 RepID=A0AAD7TTE2_9APHY|nr:hypothetical protein ONZ51_g6335 [Trametes cubensis]
MADLRILKPIASSDSRALRTNSRQARQQQNHDASKKARTRGVRKLVEVLNLPFDVFYEVRHVILKLCVASHLDPIDLLQLSRASKDLRSFVLSRKSRPLWSTVFGNIVPQMPACPEHISEPRYAHVVFERTCDACGVNQSVKVDYATPVRLCGACWKTKKGSRLAPEAGINKAEQDEIFKLLPKAGSFGGKSFEVPIKPVTTIDQRATSVYYEPEFKSVVQRYKQILQSKDEDKLQEFVDERRELTIRRLNFNYAVIAWEWKKRERQGQDDREHAGERRLAIEEKLRELGYEPSDYPRYQHDFNSMLYQPRKLTSRIWNTIRPKLIKILDQERQKRAETAFRSKWFKRLKQFENHYATFLKQDRDGQLGKRTLPGFEDALAQALDLVSAAEPDTDVTQEELAAFETAVLDYADAYRARVRASLIGLVQQAGSPNVAQPSQKAKRGKRKGKGKRKASPSDDSGDSTKEEGPTEEAEDAKPYPDMMEHWQHCHGSMRWSADHISWAKGESLHVPVLAVAMGLPLDASLTEIHEMVHSGRPECACGRNLNLDKLEPYQYFAKLLTHANSGDCCGADPAMRHRITFKSAP